MKKPITIHNHRLSNIGLYLTCGLLMFGLLMGYYFVRVSIFSSYQSDIKSQEVGLLDIFHKSYVSTVESYYTNSLNTIVDIATSPDTINDIKTGEVQRLTTTLAHQRTFQDQFNTITIFDAQGNLVTVTSDSDKINPKITIDQLNSIVKAAVAKHTPLLTNTYISSVGRSVIAFTAPITDTSGKYFGCVIGNTTLKDLVSRISYLPRFNDLNGVVLDNTGNILVNNNKALDLFQNVSGSEPVLKRLSLVKNTVINYETNFENKEVIVEGTKISIGDAGNFYVISYLNQDSYKKYTENLKKSNFKVTRIFIVLNVVLFLFFTTLLASSRRRYRIIGKKHNHEAEKTN